MSPPARVVFRVRSRSPRVIDSGSGIRTKARSWAPSGGSGRSITGLGHTFTDHTRRPADRLAGDGRAARPQQQRPGSRSLMSLQTATTTKTRGTFQTTSSNTPSNGNLTRACLRRRRRTMDASSRKQGPEPGASRAQSRPNGPYPPSPSGTSTRSSSEEIEDDLFEQCGVDVDHDPRETWLATVKERLRADSRHSATTSRATTTRSRSGTSGAVASSRRSGSFEDEFGPEQRTRLDVPAR